MLAGLVLPEPGHDVGDPLHPLAQVAQLVAEGVVAAWRPSGPRPGTGPTAGGQLSGQLALELGRHLGLQVRTAGRGCRETRA